MSYIINIDTATETAHVSLAQNGRLLHVLTNQQQKDHAAFVQTGVQQLVTAAGISLAAIAAVAVTAGPGSYTGLRVGMASAKGLCYALQKPFIAVNTLEVMTKAVLLQHNEADVLYCPMIDARRMEVFTAVYNTNLTAVLQPCALILEESSYQLYLQKSKLVFFGSGAAKWSSIAGNTNVSFTELNCLPVGFAALSYQYYHNNIFSDLAYAEPYYIKEFKTNM
jgi:tRNA threonylcarbamoyladenosine biosynthesis protein TsaB